MEINRIFSSKWLISSIKCQASSGCISKNPGLSCLICLNVCSIVGRSFKSQSMAKIIKKNGSTKYFSKIQDCEFFFFLKISIKMVDLLQGFLSFPSLSIGLLSSIRYLDCINMGYIPKTSPFPLVMVFLNPQWTEKKINK